MNLFARIAAAVALSVPGAAFAGGLVGPVTEPAVTTPYTPIAVAQPLGWGGAYAGGTIGYGRSRVGIELVPFEGISNPNGRGPSLGFFLGYNFELGNGMVLGVEGDVAWQRIRGDAAMFFPAPGENWKSEVSRTAALRARIGAEVAPGTLVTLAAGPASARYTGRIYNDLDATSFRESYSRTFTGWTIGVGVDHLLAPNTFVRGELRHSNYGSRSFDTGATVPFTVKLKTTEIRVGAGLKF